MCSSAILSRLMLASSNIFSKYSVGTSKKCSVSERLSRLSTSSSCTVQQKVDVLNMNINYKEIGHGPHVVLCNPGAFGFIEFDFGPLLTKFPVNKFTVVVWEPPDNNEMQFKLSLEFFGILSVEEYSSYGRSIPPERDFSGGNARYHRDAMYSNELMKTLGFSKYSIIGWSEGGITGLVHAAKFPESVEKLVSVAALSYITQRDIDIFKGIQNIDNLTIDLRKPMVQMYGEESYRKMWFAFIQAAIVDIYAKGGDICKSDLPNIKCPCLIVHGYRDPMIHISHAEYLHRHIKNSELHIFPKGRHNLHLIYTYEFMDLALKFLLRD